MDEVKIDAGHGRCELTEAVERRLVRPPVLVIPPVRAELLHVLHVCTVGPGGARGLVGPARACEPLTQVVQDGLRHVDAERTGRHQKTGFSTYAPKTVLRRATISPRVARAVTSSIVRGIRLAAGSRASASSLPRSVFTRAPSRRARVSRSRATWRASTAASTLWMGTGTGAAGSTKRLTPMRGCAPEARRRAVS